MQARIKRLRKRPRLAAETSLTIVLATLIALIPLVPILWVIFTAVKERGRVIKNPIGLPEEWHFENFIDAWTVGNFNTYFVNSVIVVIPTVIGVLVLALLAAYAFATMRFKLRNILFIIFLIGLTVPLSVLIIPLFYEIRDLGILSTPWALILPQIALLMPFSILLLYGFIKDLPGEIFDAGLIDGCDRWDLLRYVVAPMTLPALLTLLIFSFMWTWNQFLLPLIVIHEDAARTLPVGLNHFRGRYVTDFPLMMAGATITFIPIIIIYLVFQRHFIRGISAGALK